jgi:hypothetical protein
VRSSRTTATPSQRNAAAATAKTTIETIIWFARGIYQAPCSHRLNTRSGGLWAVVSPRGVIDQTCGAHSRHKIVPAPGVLLSEYAKVWMAARLGEAQPGVTSAAWTELN